GRPESLISTSRPFSRRRKVTPNRTGPASAAPCSRTFVAISAMQIRAPKVVRSAMPQHLPTSSIQASAAEISSGVARKMRVWPAAPDIAPVSAALHRVESRNRLGIRSNDGQQIGEAGGGQHLGDHFAWIEQYQPSVAPGQ